jgi:hypothetical protein
VPYNSQFSTHKTRKVSPGLKARRLLVWPLVTMPPRSTPTNLRDHNGRRRHRCRRCDRCGCRTLPSGGSGYDRNREWHGRGPHQAHGAGQSAGAFTAPTGQRVFCSPARHLGLVVSHFTSPCACPAAPPQPHGSAPDRPRVASAMGSTANPVRHARTASRPSPPPRTRHHILKHTWHCAGPAQLV